MTIGEKIVEFLRQTNGNMGMNILFMPYNYAMWDCMASVYKACKDNGVGCGVMPIPYFTLKDGATDEWHYEFEYFENEIDEEDLYDFNDFDKLPCDYVVIHNQYDDANNLTTIHPFFYSDVLKAKGKKIIFIPYGIWQGGQMAVTKGIANADYVFVNTFNERDTLIEAYKQYGFDMTGKVIASGSPKLDLIFEKHEMPFHWKRKIIKTVILICTSITPFLKDPKGKLEQYRDAIWNELANGHAIIFRPHPLMDATVKNKRPEYYNDWLELLEWINNDCIVDNETDLATEIEYSDRLISDESSVVELWRATGKPYKVLE